MADADLPLIIRTPVIPGVNDKPDEIGKIASFVAGFRNLWYYELLPYHPLGLGKYASIGREPGMPEDVRLDGEKLKGLAAVARQRGIEVRPSENST